MEDNRYSYVYWGAIKEFGLNLTEAALMGLMAVLSRKQGYCFASTDALTNMTDLKHDYVEMMINNLFEKNLLEIISVNSKAFFAPTESWKNFTDDIHKNLSKTRKS